MHKIKTIAIVLLLFTVSTTYSQGSMVEAKFKRHIVQLTSPSMHGRGYVQKGDSIAARYIEREFRKNKVNAFKGNYFQNYSFDVNTFPGELLLVIDGDTLQAGKDYLVIPQSNGVNDSGKVITITADDILDGQRFGDKYREIQEGKASMVYLNTKDFTDKDSIQMMKSFAYELSQIVSVIHIKRNKLTWSVGRDTTRNAIIEIIDSVAPDKIESAQIIVEQKFIEDYNTQNVIGYIEGRDQKLKDEYVIFCAHYDHLGRMGRDVYFPGANDNASGTTMLLTLMEYFTHKAPKRSVVFIAFSGEEAGLEGSNYFVNHPLFDLNKIRFVVDLDIFGSGDEGITIVNGDLHKEEFELILNTNEDLKAVPQIKSRKESYNSDHYPFTEKGVPAWFIYTMGKAKQYHDPDDLISSLELNHFIPLRNLLIRFERDLK